MTPLERVTERMMRNGNPEERSVPTPLLTLEEFFDGNDFVGSIGCNLDSAPEPTEFFELLQAFRQRPDVSDVRIQITCVDDPGNDWPFSDTIWIMTDREPSEVQHWFPDDLAPNEVWEGWTNRVRFEECPLTPGHKPVGVWYD
jgi:hypothetical protein